MESHRIAEMAKYSHLCYYRPFRKLLYVRNKDATYIGFRGVNTAEDMKQALTITPTNYKNTHVHSGFMNKYLEIKPKIRYRLTKVNTPNIYFIGHSMGGCIALLAAVDSVLEYDNMINKNVYCCTFGSPAVGNKEFMNLAYATLEDINCIELSNDIVPKLPLNPGFVPLTTFRINNTQSINHFDILGNHSCLCYYKNLSINK